MLNHESKKQTWPRLWFTLVACSRMMLENITFRQRRSASSEPIKRKHRPRGNDRTTVLTASGKQVLSSDARLHLEKVKVIRKGKESLKIFSRFRRTTRSWLRLEYERQILDAKLAKVKEIRKLQAELTLLTSKKTSEYQTEEGDSKWQQSAYSGDNAESGSSSDKQAISS